MYPFEQTLALKVRLKGLSVKNVNAWTLNPKPQALNPKPPNLKP